MIDMVCSFPYALSLVSTWVSYNLDCYKLSVCVCVYTQLDIYVCVGVYVGMCVCVHMHMCVYCWGLGLFIGPHTCCTNIEMYPQSHGHNLASCMALPVFTLIDCFVKLLDIILEYK